MITLITGGVKSGKTAYALSLCEKFDTRSYIATAEAFDEAMAKKIADHQAERNEKWVTIEEPVSLHSVFDHAEEQNVILIDCVTMWLNNLLYKQLNAEKHIDMFLKRLVQSKKPVVIVTNEVGLGVMPVSAEGCRYADELGRLNTKLASLSDRVIFLISSIPVTIKGDKQ